MVTIGTTRFNIKKSPFSSRISFTCFVWISKQRAIVDIYSINWLVLIAETGYVYCAVRFDSLNTGLFKMIVGVLTFHKQYTVTCCLFNRTTLQVFLHTLQVLYYVQTLWFYKHQHDNRVRSKLFVACHRWWFQWRFWCVPSVPGYLREEEEHKPDPWRNPIERNHMALHLDNEVASC